jgi:hypothetical protein
MSFFNRVPVGRILNWLGRDLKELDEIAGASLTDNLENDFIETQAKY